MVLNAFDHGRRVAIVTGCDTGLGRAIALGLAQAGCDIVINRQNSPMILRPPRCWRWAAAFFHSGGSQPEE